MRYYRYRFRYGCSVTWPLSLYLLCHGLFIFYREGCTKKEEEEPTYMHDMADFIQHDVAVVPILDLK